MVFNIMRVIEGKVVILGSRGVGKTRMVTRYLKNSLHKDVGPTIAASFFTCKVDLQNERVKLQIWDTAGQERFRAVAPMYYRNANAAILVFDLTQYKTFAEIKSWIQELYRNVQDPIILILVGNKLDLTSSRAVSRDEAYLYASSIGATYLETSAEKEQGLQQVFVSTALGLVRLAQEGKSQSLRHFDSCYSVTSYSSSVTALNPNDNSIEQSSSLLPLAVGIPVDSSVRFNDVGRLERPPWSIEYIALGAEEGNGWCCY